MTEVHAEHPACKAFAVTHAYLGSVLLLEARCLSSIEKAGKTDLDAGIAVGAASL